MASIKEEDELLLLLFVECSVLRLELLVCIRLSAAAARLLAERVGCGLHVADAAVIVVEEEDVAAAATLP